MLLYLCGCSGGARVPVSDESPDKLQSVKIGAEAFSFNARLYRKNKPTSFKLEVYSTDTLLGLSGRGYLGKGALRGRLSSDSLELFFPASNEYMHESLVDLIAGASCKFPIANLEIISLIRQLPDSLSEGLSVEADHGNPKRPEFTITAPDCDWSLRLVYDQKESGWRIREFYFDDGHDLRLRGIRDKYKPDAKVKPSRFHPNPPADAVRIHP